MINRKSYEDLKQYTTFEDRFNYLKLNGNVGKETFGFDRYLNQDLYHNSKDWKQVRNKVIMRDNGCDLGVEGYDLNKIFIHHINPIRREDIVNGNDSLFDMNNLICVSYDTHNALHYGNSEYPKSKKVIERAPNDTSPWRMNNE